MTKNSNQGGSCLKDKASAPFEFTNTRTMKISVILNIETPLKIFLPNDAGRRLAVGSYTWRAPLKRKRRSVTCTAIFLRLTLLRRSQPKKKKKKKDPSPWHSPSFEQLVRREASFRWRRLFPVNGRRWKVISYIPQAKHAGDSSFLTLHTNTKITGSPPLLFDFNHSGLNKKTTGWPPTYPEIAADKTNYLFFLGGGGIRGVWPKKKS